MPKEASAKIIRGLEISAPEWFERDDFLKWARARSTASWFHGSPNDPVYDFSDVFTIFDHGSGPDELEIPETIWEEICKFADKHGLAYGLIWIKCI